MDEEGKDVVHRKRTKRVSSKDTSFVSKDKTVIVDPLRGLLGPSDIDLIKATLPTTLSPTSMRWTCAESTLPFSSTEDK
jgi:hypothetical protein